MIITSAPGAYKAREILARVEVLNEELRGLYYAFDLLHRIEANDGWRVAFGAASQEIPASVMEAVRPAMHAAVQANPYAERMTAPRRAISRLHPRWWILIVLAAIVAVLIAVLILQVNAS